MVYKEYQHIVKMDDPEVDGLLVGKCYIFPKLDGTNGSVWINNGLIGTGSRRRDLSKEGSNDNAGFRDYVTSVHKFSLFFEIYPEVRLYGEWLVPHSLKTYRDDAWRKFYVFDVTTYDKDFDGEIYLPYDIYKEMLYEFAIDYIVPMRIISDPTYDQLHACVETNTFLIKEGSGVGEGIVVKNYDFVNKYGRITWGKIVRSAFKALHQEQFIPELVNHLIEKEMVDRYFTKDIVDKIYATIMGEQYGSDVVGELPDHFFEKKWIPRLLESSYYDFVREEIWRLVKYINKNKHRSIDFKNLKQHSLNKVKDYYPQLFRRTVNESTNNNGNPESLPEVPELESRNTGNENTERPQA